MYFRSFDEYQRLNNFYCLYCPFYCLYRQGPPIPPPFQKPPTGGQEDGPPMGPPPSVTPKKSEAEVELTAVDPGSLKPCRYRYVYIWLKNGKSFWVWLTYVGKTSISGWRWTGFYWVYFGIDLKKIESFICY